MRKSRGWNRVLAEASNAVSVASVVLLHYAAGDSFTTYQISREVGISPATARKNLMRLRGEFQALSYTVSAHWSGNTDKRIWLANDNILPAYDELLKNERELS